MKELNEAVESIFRQLIRQNRIFRTEESIDKQSSPVYTVNTAECRGEEQNVKYHPSTEDQTRKEP